MDTGLGNAAPTSPFCRQPSKGNVPKHWTVGFLRNPKLWTFGFQMAVMPKPQTVDSPSFPLNPKLWTEPVFSKPHSVDIPAPVCFWYNSAQNQSGLKGRALWPRNHSTQKRLRNSAAALMLPASLATRSALRQNSSVWLTVR